MKQKKIAVISDLSGFGRCSLTVSIPLISALKVQCCPLPTAVLSNHTGYKDFFFDDYTDRMEEYIEKWVGLELDFDGILTGFLGSKEQIDIVLKFIEKFKKPDTMLIVDPVMGDNGKLYSTYTEEMASELKRLCALADIVLPNLTEACILTDTVYDEDTFCKAKYQQICEKIVQMGPKKVALTGIRQGDFVANYVYEKNKNSFFVKRKRVGSERSGTGDVFASIVSADQINGVEFKKSVEKAADFIKKCIGYSEKLNVPTTDGICFEEFLIKLK